MIPLLAGAPGWPWWTFVLPAVSTLSVVAGMLVFVVDVLQGTRDRRRLRWALGLHILAAGALLCWVLLLRA